MTEIVRLQSGLELPHLNGFAVVTGPAQEGDKLAIVCDDVSALTSTVHTNVPTIVIVDRLRPEHFADVLLTFPNVLSVLENHDTATIEAAVRSHFSRTIVEPSGHLVGQLRPMPSDPTAYEASRVLSMMTPSMTSFLVELRTALLLMGAATVPDVPWDPTDSQPPPVRGQSDNRLRNLEDIIATAELPRTPPAWPAAPPPLLVLGESGTGKSLVAELVHQHLHRDQSRRGMLVPVTAAGMSVRDFDFDMHGSGPGRYTDVTHNVGHFGRASYGTLFLDEIGDMPIPAQTRLLTFFNDLIVRPKGLQPFYSFTHVIGATNRDLDNRVMLGEFRHDLLARFRARVSVPTLRSRDRSERRTLIDFVAQNPLVNPVRATGDRVVSHVANDAMDAFLDHEYRDGNFRELETVVHEAIWKARMRNSLVLERSDIRLPEPRSRPDRDERVVLVDELPTPAVSVAVTNGDELRRLADLLDRSILSDGSGRMVLLHDGVGYTASR